VIRAPFRVGSAAAITGALAAGLVAEEALRDVPFERRDRYVRMWATGMLRSFGVELNVEGSAVTSGKPHLVVSNHRSTIDIFLMLSLFGGHLLSRGDMESWPAVGWMAKKAGTLFVDRSDAASGGAAIRRITEHLKRGRTIGVFAEGTTFDDDEVRPFHAGAFMAIARVRGEVTPVGIAYEHKSSHYKDEPIGEHFKRVLLAERTRVAVTIGPAIAAEGPINVVRDRTQEAVQDLVRRSRARL
jgi:lyso-ornithine lipid O-acyltransferase